MRIPARLALVAWAAALAPGAGAAQALLPPVPGIRGGPVGWTHLEPRPGSPAVALVLALPVGSAADPEGLEGAARLLAGVVARHVSDAVGADGVVTDVEVTSRRTRIRVLALEDRWQAAWRALRAAAFAPLADAGAVASVKAELEQAAQFNAGAPILDVRRETRVLLFGAGSPEQRPPEGTIEGIRAASSADLEAFRRAHYDAESAALALVGRFDPAEARRTIGLPAAELDPASDSAGAGAAVDRPVPADSAAAAARPPPAVDAGPPAEVAPEPAVPADEGGGAWTGERPWETGDRVRIEQEVTSTWIAAAYPAPADLPRTLLQALAQRLTEELNPTPTDAGLFSARVRVVDVPRGRALLIEVAVLPDASARWEARILESVSALTTPARPEFFRWQRRRFRSEALTREAAPEEAAARYADDLLELGGIRDLAGTLWVLDAEAVARAAASLGPPRVLVYGPDLAGG